MRYKITNLDGKINFNLKLCWKGFEISIQEIYFEELKLNLKHQLT